MAWRIDEQVIRGEIDNRERGRVTGTLWFVGRDEPITLALRGDAWRDLAGRRLQFRNPTPRPGDIGSLQSNQSGEVGDITASRKVKVPDVTMEELRARYARREPFPWHWGNSLYLEWYDDFNGRIVIESAAYELTIDPEATWEMSEVEEELQRATNAGALGRFMSRLTEALDEAARQDGENETTLVSDSDDFDEDPDRPLTEAEAERLQAESDKLTDRVHNRMEREGPNADLGRIIEEELERARRERGEPEPTPEEQADRQRWIDELNAAAEEAAAETSDDEEDDDESHPLVERTRDLTLRVMGAIETHNWVPEGAGPEHPVTELEADLMKAGAKLAGALDQREWPPPLEECAATIVWLKRAAQYLEDATLAAEDCRHDQLVDPAWIVEIMRETRQLAEDVAAVIAELRDRLSDRWGNS